MIMALVLAILLMIVIPAAAFRLSSPVSRAGRARRLVRGLALFNVIVIVMATGVGLVWLFAPPVAQAAEPNEQEEATGGPYDSFAAVLAVSVGSISAAYAVTSIGSAAIGAIAERPEIFGSAIVLVGLAEGIAIYGLIIAFMILGR